LGPFTVDTDNVEQFEINGLGGDDTLTVQDLSGTDVQQVFFTGGAGSDILDASHTFVDVVAFGGEDDDTLTAGAGNDELIGDTGDDYKIGGAGDDRFIWNNGDGSDINEGDDGYDIAEINGAAEAGDEFKLGANGDRALFERVNLGPFTIDADNVEEFEINGLGGDDTLTIRDLSGTDVSQVSFDGGDGDDLIVFSGLRADYEISLQQDEGFTQVFSSTITSSLTNVEVIRFEDGDYNTVNGEFTPSLHTASSGLDVNYNDLISEYNWDSDELLIADSGDF
nr:hypothetical protein [Pleurocapsa sp. MO_226.B13]